MLTKADFREPLERQIRESNISLFVRHTRACRDANNLLQQSSSSFNHELSSSADIRRSIAIANKLLKSRCSRHLEHKLLRIAGKYAGRTFKYCKQIHDLDGLDKSRLVMQHVLIRECSLRGSQSTISNEHMAFDVFFNVWKRMNRQPTISSTEQTMTEFNCNSHVLIEDF